VIGAGAGVIGVDGRTTGVVGSGTGGVGGTETWASCAASTSIGSLIDSVDWDVDCCGVSSGGVACVISLLSSATFTSIIESAFVLI
jgi:hypothetical protein